MCSVLRGHYAYYGLPSNHRSLSVFRDEVTSLWYRALRSLTTTQASLVQLLVPVLAAFAGVAFLSERVSGRLITASALILGGVALAIVKRAPKVTRA